MRKTPYEQGDDERVALAIEKLKEARDLLRSAKCPKVADKVRLAISSARGAQVLERLRDILWPPSDPDRQWSADTICAIADELVAAGYGPKQTRRK